MRIERLRISTARGFGLDYRVLYAAGANQVFNARAAGARIRRAAASSRARRNSLSPSSHFQ